MQEHEDKSVEQEEKEAHVAEKAQEAGFEDEQAEENVKDESAMDETEQAPENTDETEPEKTAEPKMNGNAPEQGGEQIEEDTAKQKKKRKITKIVIAIVCVIGALAAAYLILCQVVKNDAIWENVTINGVSIEGLSKDEASEAVYQKMTEDYADASVTITLDGSEYVIELLPFLEIDVTDEIEQAYVTGHGEWYTVGFDWLYMQLFDTDGVNIEVAPTLMEDVDAEALVSDTGILEYRSLVETTYEQTEDGLVVHKGETGVVADGEALVALIQEALDNFELSETIECPYTVEEPTAPDFQAIADSIYAEPVSATLDPENDYEIVESTDGLMLDVDAAIQAYSEAAEGEDIEIAFTVLEPEITTEDMEENLFADLLGTYQSTATGSSEKMTNISLAVGFCDGAILLPGETFSYNELVGDTTAERGFQVAAVYMNGEVEQELGGGVCQVSSTIFSALLQTDLEVVERQNHSLTVSYVPYGMDATVYWPYLDFQFKNNHDYPIMVSVSFVNNVVSVEIWGTQESDLTVQCVVEQIGTLDYRTYRYYYDADGNLVDTEYIGRSKYNSTS